MLCFIDDKWMYYSRSVRHDALRTLDHPQRPLHATANRLYAILPDIFAGCDGGHVKTPLTNPITHRYNRDPRLISVASFHVEVLVGRRYARPEQTQKGNVRIAT